MATVINITPHANDVLLGKGTIINTHPGNQQFRTLVNSQKSIFSNAKNKVKRSIATQILSDIESLQPPGRFLVEDRSHNTRRARNNEIAASSSNNIHPNLLHKRWLVVEREKALEKIMHRLRERVDADVVAVRPVQMNVEVDDVHDQCQTEGAFSEPLRNHSGSNSPRGDVDESQVQDEGNSTSDADLWNILESSDIDTELDILVQDPNSKLDHDLAGQTRTYTLQQWIETSSQELNPSTATTEQRSTAMGNYIKSALLVALKLMECLLEAEKVEQDGHKNPIPLASITPAHVMIATKRGQHAVGESEDGEAQDIIEYVWVMSIVGDNPGVGDIMQRVFAAGKVLYYLFSAGVVPVIEDGTPVSQGASINFIELSDDAERNSSHTQKKKHWREDQSDDMIFNCVVRLESIGVPWSLCSLIRNVLDCSLAPLCEDDAYTSFVDVHVDLQLMAVNPSCFLDNIQMNTVPKLTICDKLYGRDDELLKLDKLYQSHITGSEIRGTIISGEAGAGKSKLAMHIQTLTNQSGGYYLSAKFEQIQMSLKPLSTIANMFDYLCEMVFNDSTYSQLQSIEKELVCAIGSQTNLLGVVPNLKRLMPSFGWHESSASLCVDSAVSMRYLLSELLLVILSHSKPITIVIDDIHFADQASLQLVGSLLFSAQGSPIFFALCYRNDAASMSESFNAWLASFVQFTLEPIKLESISPDAANTLISESLHLSPRLTRPLSSVLHHKTRGNPLFLRQLLDSLAEQGYIFVDMYKHRWCWELDKIMELEISDDVLELLIGDIQRLPSDLQFGIQIASCLGSCVTESMLGYLSTDLGFDLKDILQQIARKGFMIDIAGSSMFRFAHDKIQEAVYGTMPEQQRRDNHMRLGLALCIPTFGQSANDEALFFAAVNQINLGGPAAVHDFSQQNIIAELNLKAGRRSIELSDYNSAYDLFVHGISFLGNNHWLSNYDLSLSLYNEISDMALILNKLDAVKFYSSEVVSHARCFDDKLRCLIASAEEIGLSALNPRLSIESSFAILAQCGEDLTNCFGGHKLRSDIDKLNFVLQSTPDELICKMQENNDEKLNTLLRLYAGLAYKIQYFKPQLFGFVSLRLVELTIKTGLNQYSPLAFAHFGCVLVTSGQVNEGCRLGRLALKVVERRGSLSFKSRVICFVYHHILWAAEPLQSIIETFLLGHKAGQQSGDVKSAFHNLSHAISTKYYAGGRLAIVHQDHLDFMSKLQSEGVLIFNKVPVLMLSQINVLKEGMHMSGVSPADNMQSEEEILSAEPHGSYFFIYGVIHRLTRSFLFRQFDDPQRIDFSGPVAESNHQLSSHFVMGYFFEGLASFQLARQASTDESAKWTERLERGQSVLAKMKCWSEHSLWNCENKMLLLEAECLFTNGDFDRAGPLYDSAIRSAREHKFIHEEAIASELAGNFYYQRRLHQKSYSCLVHSVDCYKKWGAYAVAKRVENVISGYFGNDIDQLESSADATF